ncbi:hypothetical protein [Achromobacter xylosoxidans]|uniref:hypothetical protein n=1 Tax=Alcaligenes xylosoxydans xylosoxydans TaxID=85698 RepID=UPI002A74C09C|nr:hypothetical protein [Achromobacter xylosoxidans]WPQ35101.1 hypothetical protein SLH34_31625 [Achromobacter xylosoxidans]
MRSLLYSLAYKVCRKFSGAAVAQYNETFSFMFWASRKPLRSYWWAMRALRGQRTPLSRSAA